VVIIDTKDYRSIKDYSWYVNFDGHNWYVYAHIPGNHKQRIKLHVFIAEKIFGKIPRDLEVDHINRNTLDNRRKNLRIVSHSVNCCNRGLRKDNKVGQTGVNWFKPRKRWAARISVGGKRIFLGTFKTKEQAIIARQKAEKLFYGQT